MKIKAITAAIILALACAVVASAQRRRTAASPQPSPTPAPRPATATLSIEAGLIYNSGDVKPVARTQFFLLDEDMRTILKPFGETPGTIGSQLDFLSAFSDSPKAKAEYEQIKTAVESHIIATATTGFDGKAKFSDLTPGIRFLYGEFRVGNNRIAWNVRVELKPGLEAAVTLDNSNRAN